MPDLGKYADTVLSAYAVSIILIVILVVLTLRRSRRIKEELSQAEAQQKSSSTGQNTPQ